MRNSKKYQIKEKPTVVHESDIAALGVLVMGKPTRYDIQKHNEIVNAPYNILRLRRDHGWDIETEKYSITKPSGKRSWLAKYVLSDKHRRYAFDSGIVDVSIKALKNNITGLGVTE